MQLISYLSLVENAEYYGLLEIGIADKIIEDTEPEEYDYVTIAGMLSLNQISQITEIDRETLGFLNPCLLKNCTPAGEKWELRLPSGTKEAAEAALKANSIPTDAVIHIVKQGDSLWAISRKYGFSLNDPIRDIPEDALNVILYGSPDLFRIGDGGETDMESFQGIIASMDADREQCERREKQKELFLEEIVCPVCHGTRLKSEALCFKIDGRNIAEISEMDISTLYEWVCGLPGKMSARQLAIASDILKEISSRLKFLMDVGLEYLSLNRAARTLSGGESQRIRLATQIGSKLVNVLYILDEPSIGLHQKDNLKLIESLKTLRDEGNSVMVVEHDQEMMEAADWLVDLGPGAGENGGRLLYNGKPSDIAGSGVSSPTIDYLKGIRKIEIPSARRGGNGSFITLTGACGNNLKNVTLKLPLGMLVGISGVSGSGKSSLINQTLMPILSNRLYGSNSPCLPYSSIEGEGNVDKVIQMDQSPIGRSPRSNPATYTDIMTDIRKIFAEFKFRSIAINKALERSSCS